MQRFQAVSKDQPPTVTPASRCRGNTRHLKAGPEQGSGRCCAKAVAEASTSCHGEDLEGHSGFHGQKGGWKPEAEPGDAEREMRGALRGEEGQTRAKGSLPADSEGPRPGLSLPGPRVSQTATSELRLLEPQFPHWSFHCPPIRTVLRSQLGGA